MFNPPAGFERVVSFGRIADFHAEIGSVSEVCLYHVAEAGMVDDQVGKAGLRQGFHVILQQRFARHRHQGFRQVIGQGAHSFAPSRR